MVLIYYDMYCNPQGVTPIRVLTGKVLLCFKFTYILGLIVLFFFSRMYAHTLCPQSNVSTVTRKMLCLHKGIDYV